MFVLWIVLSFPPFSCGPIERDHPSTVTACQLLSSQRYIASPREIARVDVAYSELCRAILAPVPDLSSNQDGIDSLSAMTLDRRGFERGCAKERPIPSWAGETTRAVHRHEIRPGAKRKKDSELHHTYQGKKRLATVASISSGDHVWHAATEVRSKNSATKYIIVRANSTCQRHSSTFSRQIVTGLSLASSPAVRMLTPCSRRWTRDPLAISIYLLVHR